MKKLSDVMNENFNNDEHQLAIGAITKLITKYIVENGKEDDYVVIPDGKIESTNQSLKCNVLVKESDKTNVVGIEVCANSELEKNKNKLNDIKVILPRIKLYIYDYEMKEWWYKTGLSKPLESSSLDDVLKLL